MVIWEILLAVFLDSLVGLAGVIFLFMRDDRVKKLIATLVSFAAGTMIGGAFIHLIPESFELTSYAGELVALGFIGFFVIEQIIHWRHCHNLDCDKHPVTWLVIIGDGVHNFIDGLVIAAAFLINSALGWTTTLVIILHEVPQEVGNFAVLVHGGFSRWRAAAWTFFSQATCILDRFQVVFHPVKGAFPPQVITARAMEIDRDRFQRGNLTDIGKYIHLLGCCLANPVQLASCLPIRSNDLENNFIAARNHGIDTLRFSMQQGVDGVLYGVIGGHLCVQFGTEM